PREFEDLSCKLSSGRGATVSYGGKNVNNPFFGNLLFRQAAAASPAQESSCVEQDISKTKIRVPVCSESGVSFEVRDCPSGTGCVDGECVDVLGNMIGELKENYFKEHLFSPGIYLTDSQFRERKIYERISGYIKNNPDEIDRLRETFSSSSNIDLKKNIILVLGITPIKESTAELVDILKTEQNQEIKNTVANILTGATIMSFHTSEEIFEDNVYLITSNSPDLYPQKTFEYMKKNRLFSIIDVILSEAHGLEGAALSSNSLVVFRKMIEKHPNTPENEIISREGSVSEEVVNEIREAIQEVLEGRRSFESEIILGPEKYFIVFSHEDPLMNPETVREFARKRDVSTIDVFKGTSDKDNIRKKIIDSKNKGETTIWVDTHGLPEYICLGEGIPGEGASLPESCDGFRYGDFADILKSRGNLQEVTLILDSCFSYDFARNLLNSLEDKNANNYPSIISTANKGKYSTVYTFIESLNSLEDLNQGDPLLGRHIYETEEVSTGTQDLAVFFSRDRTSVSEEIAMNSLNHDSCGVCSGDSCPIQAVG
ncbi:MAG: hypothetical protein Q8P81_00885, partial [Nanoarchaeota archaeon]|nr:hypothetical protein [Nanoarchaeota archaeon]